MRPRLRDLPGAVLCLALALSRGDQREALQAAQLVRGLAIQVTLRWGCGELLTRDSRAVLLFSRLDRPHAGLRRTIGAAAAAAAGGTTLFILSNIILLVPLRWAMRAAGVSVETRADVVLLIIAFRLALTAVRALKSYRIERRRQAFMPPIASQPRWRLDLIGAAPAGVGHGSALLRQFVSLSDAAGATVYLVTEPGNRAFYRRAGFHVIRADSRDFEGMLLMRRVAPQTAIRLPAQRLTNGKRLASRR